jgi:Family of unknown function (DUF5677)
MPFEENGFLGREVIEFTRITRKKYADYFEHLENVNRESHRFLSSANLDPRERKQFYTAGLFCCSVSDFQALVVLSERGFLSEVQILARSLLEVHFKIAAIAKDPKTVNRLILDGERQRKKQLELQLQRKIPSAKNVSDADLKVEIEKTNEGIERIEEHIKREQPHLFQKYGRISELRIKAQAEIAGLKDQYDVVYGHFGDATHTSSLYLDSMITVDEAGEFSGFRYGPTGASFLPYALFGTGIHIQSFEKVAEIVNSSVTPALDRLKVRHAELGERLDASTEANGGSDEPPKS